MTTQDYEIVADAILPVYSEILHDQERDFDAINAIEDTVEALCKAFAKDNPRFHKATFYRRTFGYLPSEANR